MYNIVAYFVILFTLKQHSKVKTLIMSTFFLNPNNASGIYIVKTIGIAIQTI